MTKSTRRKFDKQFKLEAVKMVTEQGLAQTEVHIELRVRKTIDERLKQI